MHVADVSNRLDGVEDQVMFAARVILKYPSVGTWMATKTRVKAGGGGGGRTRCDNTDTRSVGFDLFN